MPFHASADALSGRRLSSAVHSNQAKSPIQRDSFRPLTRLSRYLCRIPDLLRRRLMFVKPANRDVGVRGFPSCVYMLIRSHTHLFSDITAVGGDGGAGIQRNLTSAQTHVQAWPGRFSSLIGWKRRHSANPPESGGSRASRAGKIQLKDAFKFGIKFLTNETVRLFLCVIIFGG